ncbi:carbohydrate ABC transporter permease [uncultured Sphaerochaeta sp.]|uniref:carbohydrate ABC transporter permease n=1 Tax=uncultured Sphaerochaeta sp. TaxID=886478 RepID=UPI002A0A3E6A|nr:carbohydrate ABC transporter permease [uncultured Sphaerochaeta sp.]
MNNMNIMDIPRRRMHKLKISQIISYILLTVLSILFLVPFLGMVSTSLKPEKEVLLLPIKIFGTHIAWENYERAWTFFPFGRFLFSSIWVAALTSLLVGITSSMAGYAFSRIRFKGRDMLFTLYLGTLMIPQQVTVIPLYLIMKRFGWYDTYTALVLPMAFTAFGTFLMRQFLMTIPFELEDAGRIDGCGPAGLFIRIILPMAKSGIATLFVFTFIGSWKSFLWPLIITSTDRVKTLPLGIYMFNGQYGTDWSGLMAAASIAIIPSFLIYIFFQRYLVEGITMTGMGGR